MLAFIFLFRATNADFTEGFDFKKSIMIVSENTRRLPKKFLKMERGVTYLDAEGFMPALPARYCSWW